MFYQLPELLDIHTEFYSSLKAKLKIYFDLELGLSLQSHQETHGLSVGDLFIKFVSLCFFFFSFLVHTEGPMDQPESSSLEHVCTWRHVIIVYLRVLELIK